MACQCRFMDGHKSIVFQGIVLAVEESVHTCMEAQHAVLEVEESVHTCMEAQCMMLAVEGSVYMYMEAGYIAELSVPSTFPGNL